MNGGSNFLFYGPSFFSLTHRAARLYKNHTKTSRFMANLSLESSHGDGLKLVSFFISQLFLESLSFIYTVVICVMNIQRNYLSSSLGQVFLPESKF